MSTPRRNNSPRNLVSAASGDYELMKTLSGSVALVDKRLLDLLRSIAKDTNSRRATARGSLSNDARKRVNETGQRLREGKRESKFGIGCFALYVDTLLRSQGSDRKAWTSNATIAKWFGVSTRYVKEAKQWLRTNGFSDEPDAYSAKFPKTEPELANYIPIPSVALFDLGKPGKFVLGYALAELHGLAKTALEENPDHDFRRSTLPAFTHWHRETVRGYTGFSVDHENRITAELEAAGFLRRTATAFRLTHDVRGKLGHRIQARKAEIKAQASELAREILAVEPDPPLDAISASLAIDAPCGASMGRAQPQSAPYAILATAS